jgi:hypothetical protein
MEGAKLMTLALLGELDRPAPSGSSSRSRDQATAVALQGASGRASRTMLASRRPVNSPRATLVFDEVDAHR